MADRFVKLAKAHPEQSVNLSESKHSESINSKAGSKSAILEILGSMRGLGTPSVNVDEFASNIANYHRKLCLSSPPDDFDTGFDNVMNALLRRRAQSSRDKNKPYRVPSSASKNWIVSDHDDGVSIKSASDDMKIYFHNVETDETVEFSQAGALSCLPCCGSTGEVPLGDARFTIALQKLEEGHKPTVQYFCLLLKAPSAPGQFYSSVPLLWQLGYSEKHGTHLRVSDSKFLQECVHLIRVLTEENVVAYQ